MMKKNKRPVGRPKGSIKAEPSRLALAVQIRLAELEQERPSGDAEPPSVIVPKPLPDLPEIRDPELLALWVVVQALGFSKPDSSEADTELPEKDAATSLFEASFDVAFDVITESQQQTIFDAICCSLGLDPTDASPDCVRAAVAKQARRRASEGACKEVTVASFVGRRLRTFEKADAIKSANMRVDRFLEKISVDGPECAESLTYVRDGLGRPIKETTEPKLGRARLRADARIDELEATRLRQRGEQFADDRQLEQLKTDALSRMKALQEAGFALLRQWDRIRKAYTNRSDQREGGEADTYANVDHHTGGLTAGVIHPGWPPPELENHPKPPTCWCPDHEGPHWHCEQCRAAMAPTGLPTARLDTALQPTAPAWTCSLACYDQLRAKERQK